MTSFYKIKVDDGPVQEYSSDHGQYSLAAMTAFGDLKLPYPCVIEIWVEDLLPEYGPYFFKIGPFVDMQGNEYNTPSVMNAIKV